MITDVSHVRSEADIDEFERYLQFVYARRRAIEAIRARLIWLPQDRWMARAVSRHVGSALHGPAVPFGWMARKDALRCQWIIGPLWYMVPRQLWINKGWALEPLRAAGFYQLPDGDYWSNGHFTFRFWEYHTEMRRAARMPRQAKTTPFSRWEAIGWWIADTLARFHADTPRFA